MLLKDIREEIVTLGNFLLDEKLVHDMQGNISYFDRESGMIAITPSAVPYRIRKAVDICVVDIEGNVLVGENRPTSEIALHTALYKKRSDIRAIIHTHPVHAGVFSITHEPIPQALTEVTMGFKGEVPVAPYACPGTQKLADLICRAMKSKSACILANHGLVTVADTLGKAIQMTLAIEDEANMVIMARSMGAEIYPIEFNRTKAQLKHNTNCDIMA